MGQTTPPHLGFEVVKEVVGETVADIGCGSGVTGYLLRAAWQFTGSFFGEGTTSAKRLVGVDWSRSTLDVLEKHSPYDELFLAGSTGIPLGDGAVETALSMENLEHLLPGEVAPALAELARIASRRVVVSTPAPWAVVNTGFLDQELAEAAADPLPMPYAEYINLVGNLHKSSVTPAQMAEAGFSSATNRLRSPSVHYGSVIYTAVPDEVDVSRLGTVVGVPWSEYPADDGREDFRSAYVDVLRASRGMATPSRPPLERRVSAVAKAVRESVRSD
jgi:SAM-dependent methyltransferase